MALTGAPAFAAAAPHYTTSPRTTPPPAAPKLKAHYGPQTSQLTVTVVDQYNNPLPAEVIALFFTNGNPDPVQTQIAVTTAGIAYFNSTYGNNLYDTDVYTIVATTQGYTPGLAAQFNNNPPQITADPSNPTNSLTISLTATPNLGEIDVPISAATDSSLDFGQVGLPGGGSAIQYALTPTDGSGNGLVHFYNVPNAPANTYVVSVNDPRSIGSQAATVTQPLGLQYSGTPGIVTPIMSMANAPPPVTNISQSQQSGQGGNLSLSGVLTDTNSANTVPYAGLNFSGPYTDQYGNSQYDYRGTQTDQNGAFQLYGLLPGVTYYTTSYGGCSNNGTCYPGFADQPTTNNTVNAPIAGQDFIGPSTGTTISNFDIKLQAAPPGTGTLAIQVNDQFGVPYPQVSIGLYPDGSQWQYGGGACNTGVPGTSNPGLKNVNLNNVSTGYALLTGLPSGNYNLNICTGNGCTSFNAPNNSNGSNYYQGNCGSSGGPFYRLTIDTTVLPSADVFVYDVDGTQLANFASTTVVVNVSTATSGTITGTLTFPSAVNLSQNSILISAFPSCTSGQQCPSGSGFYVLNNALTPQTTTYSIPVSSGYVYNYQVTSSYWGPIYAGGNQPSPDLSKSTSAVVNLQFAPAGRVVGTMRKPDGSAYLVPTNTQSGPPQINANGNSSGGWTSVNNDGSFIIGGLLPGTYTLQASNSGGSFPYTALPSASQVSVTANQDTHQDVNLVNAVSVAPIVSTNSLPNLNQLACPSGNSNGSCPPESWNVVTYPAGTPLNSTTVSPILSGSNGGTNQFQFNISTGQANGNNCNGQYLSQPGFCSVPVAANASGTSYDFYVMRLGAFDSTPPSGLAGGVRPYFVIENSSKSITVGPQLATGFQYNQSSNSSSTVQNLTLTPVPSLAGTQQATLSGAVTISNVINQREFAQLGGNFNGFLQYLPLVFVYDSSGALKGGGLVVPYPPNESPLNTALQNSVASNNYAVFETLLTAAPPAGWGPVGYEIRGLTAGQTYSIVATTPNYPPFKGTATLGAIGSTTTLSINFDANAGATMNGVVTTTASVAVAGAAVTVQSVGYPATTVATNSSGTWSLSGLPAGQYQVQVVAPGYAQAAETVSVGGSGTLAVAPTFLLPWGASSITGTVYTNNPICPAGATCSAFGKTVLQGVTVVAYDDTINQSSPTVVLPLYTAVTSSAGVYTINGLVSSDSFKVFADDPGYYVLNQSTLTVAGGVTGFDFALKPKPLSVNVFGYPAGTNYEFQITNYQRFLSGLAWIGPQTGFSTNTATQVSFVQKPDSSGNPELFLDYPLSSLTPSVSYILEIIAQPNDPTAPQVISQTVFGQGIPNNACQAIDQSLLGIAAVNASGVPANLAPLDITGANASGLSLPVGGLIPSASTSVPTMCMNQTAASVAPAAVSAIRTSALNIDAFLSGVYDVSLSSINYVLGKGVNLTLSYNQATTNINDAAIFSFNQLTQQWQSVPGLQTIDPVRGTISVNSLVSLAGVLSEKSSPAVTSRLAVSTGRGFVPNASAPSTDTGQFAILAPSQVGGGAFTGTIVKVYNFPNPFNLQTKSVTLNTAAGVCSGLTGSVITNGTVIKYEIPSGISGTGVIRIYTTSGRLVREVDAGNVEPNNCYYTTWDGENRNGLPVANGIYYGVLSVAGSKLSSGTFKLAVIK
jgi:hypothetical protein